MSTGTLLLSVGNSDRRIPFWVHAVVWGIFLSFSLAAWILYLQCSQVTIWDGWRECQELRRPAYAETVHIENLYRTRSNTLSNLAYILVGLYAVVLGMYDKNRVKKEEEGCLAHTPAMSFLFGAACCILGFGSGLFHASLTRIGQQLDVAAMYAPLIMLLALNGTRFFPTFGASRRPTWPYWGAVAVFVSILLFVFKWQINSRHVLPALILLTCLFVALDFVSPKWRMAWYWPVLSLISVLIAFAFRDADIRQPLVSPDSWIQGHALWHLGTVAGLAFIYLYHRSERRRRLHLT